VGRLIIHFQERKKITAKCEAVYNFKIALMFKNSSFPVTNNNTLFIQILCPAKLLIEPAETFGIGRP
jgi:hypothetical protein